VGAGRPPGDTKQTRRAVRVRRVCLSGSAHTADGFRLAASSAWLDPPRAIGWLPGTEKGDGQLEFGGWIWRYDLAPLGPSETDVTLACDWSAVPQFIREYLRFPPFGPGHLTNSLRHLAELATTRARAF